jgi:hypothetical protein
MREIRKMVIYQRSLLSPGGAERLLLEEYNFLKNKE